MRRLLLTSLVVAVACATSGGPEPASPMPLSERWVVLGTTDGRTLAVDTASITMLEPQVYRLWFHVNFAAVQRLLGDEYVAQRDLADYDCRNRTIRIQTFQILDSDGNVVLTSEYPDMSEAKFRPVKPETPNELQYSVACVIGPRKFGR